MGNVSLKPRHVGVGTFKSTPKMIRLVNQALESGRISYGPLSQEFERKFAELHECQYAILSNSGTSALMVALQAMKEAYGWSDGDEVIVPATTFVATANIVKHCNMIPVFVDIEPYTWNIDPNLIEPAISDRTKAIIPVHLFGQPANMHAVMDIAHRHALKVIEDSAEAMFVGHHKRPVGSWGHVGCFSTYVAHILVTGVGGVCTTNDPDLAARIRSLVNHGLDIKYLNTDDNFSPQPMGNRRFRFGTIGHSFRITEMEAAVGLPQIDEWQHILRIRARNANHLNAGLSRLNSQFDGPMQLPVRKPENGHSWMMYPIVLNKRGDEFALKDPVMEYLHHYQIETRDMLPILGQPAYRYLNRERYPISDWVEQSGFYIGCHQNLEPEDIDYVVQTLENWFGDA